MNINKENSDISINVLSQTQKSIVRINREYDRILNLDGCSQLDRAHYIGIKLGLKHAMDTIQLEIDGIMEEIK